jgi:hypothetical protein
LSFRTLGGGDQRILFAGAVIAITSLISFVDPSGGWGGIMIVSVLAGAGAAYVSVQPQVSPTMQLPAPKGTSLLVLGAAATAASAIALLSYIGYVFGNLTDIYEIIFLVGLIASIYLLWVGWTSYKAETGARTAPPAA